MYERKIDRQYCCGLEITMEIIGGKWKPIMIKHIHAGITRPSELQRAMPLASRRALTLQLNELVEHGIIEKKIYPVTPPHVEYKLTEFGTCLLPIAQAMEKWGNEYRDRFNMILEQKKEGIISE